MDIDIWSFLDILLIVSIARLTGVFFFLRCARSVDFLTILNFVCFCWPSGCSILLGERMCCPRTSELSFYCLISALIRFRPFYLGICGSIFFFSTTFSEILLLGLEALGDTSRGDLMATTAFFEPMAFVTRFCGRRSAVYSLEDYCRVNGEATLSP